MDMKGSKKRKARQLDDIDYIPILKPIPDPETAQKVAAAMRQTMENSRVLSYLLQRIKVSPVRASQVHHLMIRSPKMPWSNANLFGCTVSA
jgi:histone-lysine N-methyltransferase SETD2